MPSFPLEAFDDILKLNIGVAQSDNQEMFDLLQSIAPMKIFRFPSGIEHNGWVVNDDWVVHKALIKKDGEVLYDGTVHPLAVGGYSSSFVGAISKDELDDHVFYREDIPDAIPFQSAFNYRPWVEQWCFCIPYRIYKEWGDGDYEVELVTEYKPGEMLVGEMFHAGESSEMILFNAHTCHPGQFNDGFSGALVMLALFKWLATQKTRYSYLGILAPEHVGTVFYSANKPADFLAGIKQSIFVEMVGTSGPLVLQRSFTGEAIIDRVAEHVMRLDRPDLKVGSFRAFVGNDETVWEAPGLEIPTATVTRCPYPEYHTHFDDLNIISEEKLSETLDVLKRIVGVFERDGTVQRHYDGLVALSNPRYNLYIERPDPTWQKKLSSSELRLGEMQDYLPRFYDNRHTVFEIAEAFDVSFEDVITYLQRLQAKELVTIKPLESMTQYNELRSKQRLGFDYLQKRRKEGSFYDWQ